MMTDIPARAASDRFCPEVRGWAALRLAALVPGPVREAIERKARLPRPGLSDGPASETGDFARAALALASSPAAVAWSRQVAEQVPVLGPVAGPASIARLWADCLLRPGSCLKTYWPDAVGRVWNVIKPMLEKMGLCTYGSSHEDLRHEVAAPLALVFLQSLAAGRKDLRLVGLGLADRPDGPPFGWAPGIDAISPLLRYLVAGQVPGRFQSHALLSSPLARAVCEAGIAVPVTMARWRCPRCRGWPAGGGGPCPQCGAAPVQVRVRRLVSPALVGLTPAGGRGLETLGPPALPLGPGGFALAVLDRVEARGVRQECIQRARALWERAVQGRSCNSAAMVVLGALAGVRPLVLMAERPPPRQAWLDALVEALADGPLDRARLGREANLALAAVAAHLGRPVPPPIGCAYVGVLATRLRQAILVPRSPRAEWRP
ncbi:MAG: hypothetical protein IMZ44_02195 [Planctomycetes bacterium]|nr:hypothetical protein [Planctomycetota bacterium]